MLPGIMPDEITAAVNPPELSMQKLAALARDVAMNMLPLAETLRPAVP